MRTGLTVWLMLFALVACDDGEGDPDAAPVPDGAADAADVEVDAVDMAPDVAIDAAPDVALDAAGDMAPDMAPDAEVDMALDAAPDAEVDMAPDAEVDMAPDAEVDMAPDAVPDAESDMAPIPDAGPACDDANPCPGEQNCVGGRCIDGECLRADDCGDDAICIDRTCVAGDCAGDVDCGPDRLCLFNRCAVADCRVDGDCAEGARCVDHRCGACRGDADCPDGLCEEGRCVPGACRDDVDCAPGTLCVERQCVPGTCRVDADCGARAVCLDRQCVLDGCRGDADCPGGRCDGGLCVPGDCGGDGDCPEGVSCVRGVCGGPCVDDGDCGEGAVCLEAVCTPGDCRGDRDCGPGTLCIDDRCAPADCRDANDCPPGALCLDGRCEALECAVDRDCQSDDGPALCFDGVCAPECVVDGHCAGDDRCLRGYCTADDCFEDRDCAAGAACLSGACVDAGCRDDLGCAPAELCIEERCVEAQCRGDDDCPDGTLCRDRLCVVGQCTEDADCPDGVPCIDRICIEGGCRGDADCGPGTLCDADRCVEAECRVDVDCADGRTCVRATCVEGDCIDDGDCDAGLCLDGVCTADGCRGDADCDPGALCLEARCAIADCRDDGDCGPVQSCLDFTCVAGQCRGDPDCADGELCLSDRCTVAECRADAGCPDGRCVQRRCIDGDCLDDGDCDGGSLCIDQMCTLGDCRTDLECGPLALCLEQRCVPGDCRIDGDCAADSLCVEGYCTPAECRIDDECDRGRRCDGGFCVDDPLFAGCAAALPLAPRTDGRIGDIAVQAGSCGGAGAEQVFRHTFADARPVCAAVEQSTGPVSLYARSTCAEPETELGCAPPADVRAGLTLQGEADGVVFVSVDAAPGVEGPFVLTVVDGACPEPCAVDAQCADLELCIDTLCVPSPICAADATCPAGRLCIDGRCQPPECAEDADCGAVELCVDERCVPGDCREDGDCAEGICVGRLCQPDGCRDDGGCADGVCLDLTCIPGGCRADADCAEGICVALRCVGDGCRDDAGCADGALCLDYACRVAECRTDGDCAAGEICEDDLCVERICDLDAGVPCPGGEICTDFRCAPIVPRFGTCDAPVDLPVSGTVPGDLNFARPDEVGSCGGDGPDSVYRLAPGASGTYCAFVETGDFDAIIYARSACANGATEIACNDDDPFAGRERGAIEFALGDGGPEEVFVVVDGSTRFDFGPFTVRAVAGPCGGPEPCADDADCAFDGDVCVEGTCGVVECRRDIECGDGRACMDFECAAPECLESADCPADAFGPRRCVDFVCERAADVGTCASPLPVLADEPILGSTENGLAALTASCAGRAASREQVHLFVPRRDGPHCATTAGSDFDTAVHVRTDCADPATEIACDDNGAGLQSAVTFAGVEGEAVAVVVDGYGDDSAGAYTLRVTRGACGERPACGVDGDCLDGEACVRGGCQPDPCRVAPDIVDGQVVDGDTRGAPERIEPGCGVRPSGPELLYRYTAVVEGPVCIDTAGSGTDTVLSVRDPAACLVGAEAACADDDGPRADRRARLTLEAEAGAEYLIAVDGAAGDAGRVRLVIDPGPCDVDPAECATDADCPAACVDKRCVADVADACAGPLPLAVGDTVDGDTTGAPSAYDALCAAGAEGPERVYAFTVDVPGPVCARVDGAFDTVLHVRDGPCRAASREIGCNDDAPGGLTSALTVDAEPGRIYHLFVDGYGFDRGPYTLALEAGRCAPCADDPDCVDAAPGTCGAPVVLEEPIGTHRSTTRGAGDGLQAGCSELPSSAETVFAFTAPADGPLCLTTAGPIADTVLSVRDADCAAELGCNDDAARITGTGWHSALTLDARGGVDYRVVVDAVDGVEGPVDLTIAEGKCGPPSFAGVRGDVSPAELDDLGLELCWQGLYDGQTPLDTLLEACDRPTLLLGCRPVGDADLVLAAMGEREALLTDPGGAGDATDHNGASWYFDPDGGWGFAPADAVVERAPCDTEPGPERMCWHTLDGQISSGYRCGDVFLNGSNRWERLIFQRTEGLRP